MSLKRTDLGSAKFGNILTGRLGLTRYRIAKAIGVPQRRIDEVCSGKRAVSADTALRLGRFFSVEPQLWMNLQSQFDLEVAERTSGQAVEASVVPLKDAA